MRTRVATFLATTLALVTLAASPAAAAPTVLRASLTGAAVPTGGLPGGSGDAVVVIDSTGRVCTVVVVRGVPDIIAAHIHKGAAGQIGPHAIDLNTPLDYGSGTGVSVTCDIEPPALVADLIANPSGYYVNVHSFAKPLGAVRGQLVSLAG